LLMCAQRANTNVAASRGLSIFRFKTCKITWGDLRKTKPSLPVVPRECAVDLPGAFFWQVALKKFTMVVDGRVYNIKSDRSLHQGTSDQKNMNFSNKEELFDVLYQFIYFLNQLIIRGLTSIRSFGSCGPCGVRG